MKISDDADVIRFSQDVDGRRVADLVSRAAESLGYPKPFYAEDLLRAMDDVAHATGWFTRRWEEARKRRLSGNCGSLGKPT